MKSFGLSHFILLFSLGSIVTAEDWARFRGPTGQGISAEIGVPVKWSVTDNVSWKSDLPGEGWSSPIISKGRIFVTATTEGGASCHVICLDRKDGRILWDTEVFKQEVRRKEGRNSYATPTPVADGQLVYAFFSAGGAAAISYEGKVAWTNHDNKFYSQHGLGASPILYKDLLIMPFDGSSPGPDTTIGWKKPWDQAFILALDTATGNEKWKARRGMSRIAHVTPQVATVDGKEILISGAGDAIQGFDLNNGERLWSVYSQGEGVTPSVVVGNGMVFTASGFEADTIRVVRLDGKASGDITKTHIAWEQKRAVPSLSSLLLNDGLLYSVKENGIALCMDAKDGSILWQERLEGTYSASPVFATGHIYYLSDSGRTTVLLAGREFKVVAENDLEGSCQASPAISDGQIFIRTEKSLYCIGKK